MALTAYILGSAQDGGLPQFGSRMKPDMNARTDPLGVRLGPSICVLDDDGRCFLVDVSPDIKEQENRLLKLSHYVGRQGPNPFDAVLLTHAHMGHYAGLVHFGREGAKCDHLPVYCTGRMGAFLGRHAPWEQLVALGNIRPQVLNDDMRFEPWAGLSIRAIIVPHRDEYTDTVGVSINETLLYVPDIDDWSLWPEAHAEVENHEVSLLDGTFYSRDELPGRDLSEISHPFITDTIETFKDLTASRRIILTHFNHSNPVCNPGSEQARACLNAGFELAQEMMSIQLT